MTEPFRPVPPDGYKLYRQIIKADGNAIYEPHLPISAFATLLVFNGWVDKWEKPQFLFTGDPAWLAAKE